MAPILLAPRLTLRPTPGPTGSAASPRGPSRKTSDVQVRGQPGWPSWRRPRAAPRRTPRLTPTPTRRMRSRRRARTARGRRVSRARLLPAVSPSRPCAASRSGDSPARGVLHLQDPGAVAVPVWHLAGAGVSETSPASHPGPHGLRPSPCEAPGPLNAGRGVSSPRSWAPLLHLQSQPHRVPSAALVGVMGTGEPQRGLGTQVSHRVEPEGEQLQLTTPGPESAAGSRGSLAGPAPPYVDMGVCVGQSQSGPAGVP